jgi:GTP pyrophosphokinase
VSADLSEGVIQPASEQGDDTPRARYLISDLCAELEAYLTPEQVREVYRAYVFGAEAHEGQKRMSGEPYIYHPVAVARILSQMKMDHKCLMAAILHDVIEDTPTAKDQLVELFDEEIAELVDGVSKLTHLSFRSKEEAQAENFRKMLLAMTKDIRVIMIKLADRLHNMRTLGVMRPDKARRIARETLEIYAPIANRLGINSIRHELEELGMAAHWPNRYRILQNALKRQYQSRREIINNVRNVLVERLEKDAIPAEVSGRRKRVYSIYRKMRDKKLPLNDLADVFAFRVVVDSVDTCYRVLGAVHNLYRPMPGAFKDYIAIPKANGYQSLHTILFGPQGTPIEIQIRTEEMHLVAEEGIAAHWRYKTGERSLQADAAAEWMRNVIEVQQDSGSSLEFLENVKVDLFPVEVYVFTPRGKIIVLPKGSTVIDFAYAVHSDVGNQCVAARVDRQLAPLRTRLRSGQQVEIITKPDARPHPSWLNFVVTGKARASIRSYMKRLESKEAITLGRRLLEEELTRLHPELGELTEDVLLRVATDLKHASTDDLLNEVGLGNRMPSLIIRMLAGDVELDADNVGDRSGGLVIHGGEGMVVNYGRCCGPIPGDNVVGVFSPGKGIVVHHHRCPNLGDFEKQGQSWVDVRWGDEIEGEFMTMLRIDAGNQRGMLATVASAIAAEGSNIEDVHSEERDGLSSSLRFTLMVKDRRHLASIIKRVRHIPAVLKVGRLVG